MTSPYQVFESDSCSLRPSACTRLLCLLRSGQTDDAHAQPSSLLASLLLVALWLMFAPAVHAQGLPTGVPREASVPYAQLGPRPGTQPVSDAARPHPAVVRIIVPEKDGISYGSGTLVDVRDQYGLVVTNWHVVRDAADRIEVVFPDGFRSFGQALKVDKDWDLAALVIWRPKVSPVPLAGATPQPGDALTIAGYGKGTYRSLTGQCTQYLSPTVKLPREMVEVSVAARQGDSGGPIFNTKGELAGVLWGAGEVTTLGSYVGRVGGFLASVAPHIGTHNETQIAARLRDAPPIRTPFANQLVNQKESSSATSAALAAEALAESPTQPAPVADSQSTAPAMDAEIPLATSDAGLVAVESGKLAQTLTQTEPVSEQQTETEKQAELAAKAKAEAEESLYAQTVAEALEREDAAREAALLREEAEFQAPNGMNPSLEAGFRTELETASKQATGIPPLAATVADSENLTASVGADLENASEAIIEIPVTWQDVAGESYFDQAKTILAALGLLAIAHFFMKRSGEESE